MFNLSQFVARARELGTDTQDVEVKAAGGGLPKDIVETISAFANSSGGIIVCGLSEKDGFAPVRGFQARNIADSLEQRCNDAMEPPVRARIGIEDFEGARVVVARIPETEPFLKPCYVRSRTPYGGSFIRSGDGDHELSRYEVDRVLESRRQPVYDHEVIEDASVSEFDEELLAGLLRKERADAPRVFGKLTDEEALLSLGAVGRAADGQLRPTIAGIMALAVHPQRHLPRANVTLALVPGTSKADVAPGMMRLLDTRTIVGPIPVMVCEAMAAIRANMRNGARVVGALRSDVPDYPEEAVREAIANALMHRDYSPEGRGTQVQVCLYSDRMEISNPGGLFGPVTVERLGDLDASACRNETLSRLLECTPYPVGYAETGYVVENKGTGYFQIMRSLEAAGMPAPEPRDLISMFYLTFRKRGMHAALPSGAGLKESERLVAEYLAGHRPCKASELVGEVNGYSQASIYRALDGLAEKGIVTKNGRSYAIAERLPPGTVPFGE